MYRDRVKGPTLAARMESLKRCSANGACRSISMRRRGQRRLRRSTSCKDIARDAGRAIAALPLLTVAECPYPELAEKDRGICAVEKMLFAKLLDEPVRLSQCRLDGHSCCQFRDQLAGLRPTDVGYSEGL